MKHFLVFALLFGINLTPISSAPLLNQNTLGFIVITDGIVYLTADDYMSAQSVRVELLDGYGNIQAATATRPGNTVTFMGNSASRYVRSTYTMGSGQEYTIVDDLIIM